MKRTLFHRDRSGATAVETALAAPVFCMVLFGACQVGLILWNKTGLQRGVEMAARCAVINPSLCPNVEATKTYAAAQTYGLNPPSTVFTVTSLACGTQVSASRNVQMLAGSLGLPAVTVTARSCFPT